MGWLIVLGVLALLAVLPLGAGVVYNTHGLLVSLIIGPARFVLFPGKKSHKEDKKKPEEKKPSAASENKKKQSDKTGGSITDFLPLVHTAIDFLGDLRRKLRIDRLELKLILAGGDPCDLAINYGRAWTALGNLVPRLEELFVIRKKELEVECDFCADQTLIFARLDLTITLGRLLALAVCYGIRVLRQYLEIMNKRKGGAKT